MKKENKPVKPEGYNKILDDIRFLLDKAKAQAYKAVDNIRVQIYWQIGKRIVREDLQHKERADYGIKLIINLAEYLDFSKANIHNMVLFYRTYPIVHAVPRQLSWTHIVSLIYIHSKEERQFYESQTIQNSWGTRELENQEKKKVKKQCITL